MSISNGKLLTAGALYATSQGQSCMGPEECHWCGAPCERKWPCDDTISPIFGGSKRFFARRPGNGYICIGCKIWRRPRVTIDFIGGGFKDGQSAEKWSWFVTPEHAYALRPDELLDRDALYNKLLDPPRQFSLALKIELPTQLQHIEVNDLPEINSGTPLKFTLDNKLLTYTTYELEYALKHGPEGTDPGVQAIIKMFGAPVRENVPEEPAPPKRGRGRPPKVKEEPSPGLTHSTESGLV